MQFLAAPRVQGDTIGHVQSMADGKWYDSKSALRKGYRAAGVQEVGNEVPTARRKPTRAEVEKRDRERYGALARAMSKVGLGAP